MLTEAIITSLAAILTGLFAAMLWRRRLSALKRHQWAGWLGLFAAISGVALIVFSFSRFQTARERQQWPVVTAVVTKSEITGNRVYNPRITYEYEVDGVAYEGVSRVGAPGFGGKHKRLEVAETITEEHPVGSTLEVYYDPDDPGYSQMIVHASWAAYMKLSVGVTFILGGIFLFAGMIAAPKPKPV